MKAITIRQPFAEMILRGRKRVENRTWRTHYRGPLIIHAQAMNAGTSRFPTGALVGMVYLTDCRHINECYQHDMFGFQPIDRETVTGPWCWCLENPRRFETPIVYPGRQGLWSIPVSLQATILERLGDCAKSG